MNTDSYNRNKKSIFIMILLLISMFTAHAQKFNNVTQKNTVYASYKFNDDGLGLCYERIFRPFGLYVGCSYGNYYLIGGSKVTDHIEGKFGVTKHITLIPNVNFSNIFSIGISYSTFGKISPMYMKIPDKILSKPSLDIGAGAKINRISTLLFYDCFKNELCINVGFNF